MAKKPGLEPVRSVNISVRISPTTKRLLDRAAAADGRTMSQWVERVIVAALAKGKG